VEHAYEYVVNVHFLGGDLEEMLRPVVTARLASKEQADEVVSALNKVFQTTDQLSSLRDMTAIASPIKITASDSPMTVAAMRFVAATTNSEAT